MASLSREAMQGFEQQFGYPASALYYAPGRVNLIGEHTDYNGGFVLPCAIDRGTYLAVKPRQDNLIRIVAGNLNNSLSEWPGDRTPGHDTHAPWADYPRGVFRELLGKGLTPTGLDVYVLGNVPQGAGLSSSASFAVGFATACCSEMGLPLSAKARALVCQAAENNFVGCNCGIMDQLISAAGVEDHALLIDCRSLDYRPYPLPTDLSVLIIDSDVTRGLVGSEYNTRRQQCEDAAKVLGVESLRDATLADLENHRSEMRESVFRRARHIVTENQRTQDAALALTNRDYKALNRLMRESHISMQNDFEITTEEVDLLATLVHQQLNGVGGARMTGGGFGGCVVALVESHQAQPVIDSVVPAYNAQTGLSARAYICQASTGATQLI